MDITLILIAAAAFLFAGTVKGLVGLGLPTAFISMLSQVIDPRVAIALLFVPALVLNVRQVQRSGGFRRNLRAVMFVTIWYVSRFAASLNVEAMLVGVGTVIVLFVLSNLLSAPPPIPARLDKPLQVIAGLIAGVMGGLTAIWSPPMVIYLLARRVDSETFIGTTGILILAGSIPLFFGYWQVGLLTAPLAGISAVMIVPALLGFGLGEWMRRRLNPPQFKRLVLVVFFLMGLNLLRKGLL